MLTSFLFPPLTPGGRAGFALLVHPLRDIITSKGGETDVGIPFTDWAVIH